MSGLTAAIERADWRTAALYLLLGVSQAASRLPAERLEGLLQLLADGRQPAAGEEEARGR